jgi:hypothetical protein
MPKLGQTDGLVGFYHTTWHSIPEDSHLHHHHHDNLKSDIEFISLAEIKVILHGA